MGLVVTAQNWHSGDLCVIAGFSKELSPLYQGQTFKSAQVPSNKWQEFGKCSVCGVMGSTFKKLAISKKMGAAEHS